MLPCFFRGLNLASFCVPGGEMSGMGVAEETHIWMFDKVSACFYLSPRDVPPVVPATDFSLLRTRFPDKQDTGATRLQ